MANETPPLAKHWCRLEDGRIKCELCPHGCVLAEGRFGVCRVRQHQDGQLVATTFARVTSVAMDPVEKKPLYHFHPGRQILSLGSYGCNFRCKFCQNWQISQETAPTEHLPPARAAELAVARGSVGLAFTYNEPTIWFEYLLACAEHARSRRLKMVLVTNGFIAPDPLGELLEVTDAANIDLKSFDDQFYRKLCAGRRDPVLETIKTAAKKIHVELTCLIIPGHNDRLEQVDALASWVADQAGRQIPLHLSAYFPCYQFQVAPTPLATLAAAYEVAKKRLEHVFLGNVAADGRGDTICRSCGAVVVRRSFYRVNTRGMNPDGTCARCGADNNIVVN